MKNHYIYILVMFLLCGSFLQAQTLSGYIYDKKFKEPVWNVTVYLNGTSYNTITDVDGRFELPAGQQVNASLVISHLQYENVLIETPFSNLPDTIYLQERLEQIDEIVVKGKTEKYSREKKLKAFRNQFLGTNTGGKRCRIVNEDDIRIIYDSGLRQLTATANTPIIIENSYLGYELQYDLKEFTVWYSDNSLGNSKMLRSYYLGTSFFKDTGSNKPTIVDNREKVYQSSINNFIRNLHEGTLDESGFIIEMEEQRLLLDDCFTISHSPDGTLVRLKENLFPKNMESNRLDIVHGAKYSQVLFYTDSFLIDNYHIIAPSDKVAFAGDMGGQRVGSMLPSDYTSIQNQAPQQQDNTVVEYFREQLQAYPQEKVHLHTDRDYYVPGERIWFKAYLTDAATHQPSLLSRYVYVELINSSGVTVNQALIRPENGMHHGHIFLSEMVPEGYYTLRAYTRYMDNPDSDYFFRKRIRIGSLPLDKQAISTKGKQVKPIDYEVSFFPEGGHLLEGALCNVAFKALDKNGVAISVSGVITDANGNVQTSLQTIHAGMGVFGFIPEKGKSYYAECEDASGNKKQFSLPQPLSGAYSLAVTHGRNGRLAIERLKSADITTTSDTYILLHCRGQVLCFDRWDESNTFISFQKEELPTGIIHVLLFDERMNPLSERLAFSRNDDESIELDFTTDKEHYDVRDLVKAGINITDADGQPLAGNFSVSVTDDKDQAVDYQSSILSTILLTSELKGYIESPAYYLEERSEKSEVALDCLMMTHGWRRYNIPSVAKGEIEQPKNQPETSLSVSGKTVNKLTGKPFKNRTVDLMVMNTGESFNTKTDKDGHYIFSEFEFPEDTKFYLQSKSGKEDASVELRIDKEHFPEPNILSGNQPQKIALTDTTRAEAFIEKATERYKFDDDMRIVHLQDVEVVAQKPTNDPKPFSVFSKMASVSIGLTELEEKKPATLLDIFNAIPGLTPILFDGDPNDIILSFDGGTSQAAIFINDVYMESKTIVNKDIPNPLDMVSPNNIERVDVFRPGSESGVYGLLGVYGVISITTKQGANTPANEKETLNQKTTIPLGYQKPVAFYAPRYDTQEQKFDIKPDLRTTIFWKPDIVTNREDGNASFDFYTSDFSTTYSVIIEGISENGKIICEKRKIIVNQ